MRDRMEAKLAFSLAPVANEPRLRISADCASARWNADIIACFFRVVLSTGDADRAATFLAENFDDHDAFAGMSHGPRGVVDKLSAMWNAFPDGRWQLEEIVAAGDSVAARSAFTGTHLGALGAIGPTGRFVEVAFMDFYELAGGRITAHWHVFDRSGMMRALGAG